MRACLPRNQMIGSLGGCQSASHEGESAIVCYCDTDRCNGAAVQDLPMSSAASSSFNYGIMAVALIINGVIG